jgi:hypothetical protein
MKQSNPHAGNFGNELGPRQLTTDTTKPPVIKQTLQDFLRVQQAVQAKARAVAAGRDTFKPTRKER